MEFSAALVQPPETEWSELRLTKCARQAASPFRLCRSLKPPKHCFGGFGESQARAVSRRRRKRTPTVSRRPVPRQSQTFCTKPAIR